MYGLRCLLAPRAGLFRQAQDKSVTTHIRASYFDLDRFRSVIKSPIKNYLSFCNHLSEKRIANGFQFYEIYGHLKELLKIFHEAEIVVSMLDRRHRLEFNDEIKIA